MKRAVQLPEYRDVQAFQQPAGVVDVQLDKGTNLLVTPACQTETYTAAFIAGTEPKDTCEQSDHRNIFQKLFGLGQPPQPVAPPPQQQPLRQNQHRPAVLAQQPAPGQPQTPAPAQEKKKKGFWGKLAGVFKADDEPQQPPPANPK
jgi:penicillin-binding protein 1B